MELAIGEYIIRSWDKQDIASLSRYANNYNVWINLRDGFPHPYTEEDARKWIRHSQRENPQTNFAIATSHEAIGAIGLVLQPDVHRISAEIGYWLGEPFWNLGIASAAVKAMTKFAFEQFDLVRLHAGVFEWNPASARVLEKAGYVYEGRLRKSVIKDGKIIDQLFYAHIREDLR
ncbi:MAG: GNAT family N-acetyltransferase [Aliifodinibius sp.]|nr:GNAT family N-acetyltransferase [Fodinibius sp.]NIV15882.1 GNAT family N-acetyltransferase [Fodinibius sp.]NIY29829.1 GNAT family N-acetyltransferase [Fodinibius sp.]